MLHVVSIPSGSEGASPEVVNVDSSDEDDDVVPLGPLWGPPVCAGAPPLRFQGYQRGHELGSGACGRVFLCRKPGAGGGGGGGGSRGEFAVKTVDMRRLEMRSDVQKARSQVTTEVEILRTLPPHRNIVRLFDAFQEGHWFLIILELVDGGDLFTALQSRRPARFRQPEALHVVRQVADGLAFLHQHHVIHRDLKLENLLVTSQEVREGQVLYNIKLTDFGLSKIVGDGYGEAHSCVGTKPYMAPEVFRGKDHSYDFSLDVWCLGVLLYVMVVGKYPFDSTPTEQEEVSSSIQRIRRNAAAKGIMSGLLQIDHTKRMSLEQLLQQDWSQLVRPEPAGEEDPGTARASPSPPAEMAAKRDREGEAQEPESSTSKRSRKVASDESLDEEGENPDVTTEEAVSQMPQTEQRNIDGMPRPWPLFSTSFETSVSGVSAHGRDGRKDSEAPSG
mmetsp:Transcript_70538/g.153803  ORF Transcript_70538/g.153803 Transcript_70538/m.153803 type:complete len:447 (-) Transcript_70538:249-1589(-)